MKNWEMNENQRKFVEVLKNRPEGITLFELKLEGIEFKSGSINALIGKGIVSADDEREFKCDVVYNGVVVGHITKTGKVYRLVSND